MSLSFELYWSFRSPYSYLATGRIVQLTREYDVDVDVRIVMPLAIRKPDFFEQVNPLWPMYLLRDTMRIAQYHGIDYAWPQPDPVVQEFPSRKVAKEQPHFPRLTRLGQAAVEKGRGLAFIDEVSKIIWSGKVVNWHEGSHLADAASRAGLDFAELERLAAENAARYDAEVDKNQERLEAAGHWGVPTMVFEGEPFFGQDRIELLVWRMKQHGLQPRR
ncbi:MAG TPA: DsbA family protein [Candidatus Binatia bacterium]